MGALPPTFLDDSKTIERSDPKKSGPSGDELYIDALFKEYKPTTNTIHYGICTAVDTVSKMIVVEEDVEITHPSDSQRNPPRIVAKWGRPTLTESEIVNKRVKLSYTTQIRRAPVNSNERDEEYIEILLHQIKPDNAPAMWEHDYA